jgi:DNA-binding GntR family transcriptional regulator
MASTGVNNDGATPDRKAALGHALRQRILTMELQPGAALDETTLSEEFGLSRPPVRELLRQMAGEGYVELEANRGARVMSMSHLSLRNFYLVAPMIYVATTRLAAERATLAEIDDLKRIQKKFRAAVKSLDVEARIFQNAEFHLRIGDMAHNEYLMPSLRRLMIDHARIGRTFYQHPNTREMQASLEMAVEHHDQIIDAIEKRESEVAGEIILAHFELSRSNMVAYAAPAGLSAPAL